MKYGLGFKVLLPLAFAVRAVYAVDYYADATGGNDFSDGLAPERAFRMIDRAFSTAG